MKRLVFLFALLMAAPLAALAQEPEPEPAPVVEEENRTVGIVDSLGRDVVVVRGRGDKEKNASLSVAGFTIEFGARKELVLDGRYFPSPKDPTLDVFSAIQLGFNMLTTPDYSGYTAEEGDFMALSNGRSIHFSFNLIGLDVPLSGAKSRSKFTFSTSLGMKWNNYVFTNNLTLRRVDDRIRPVPIDGSFRKSKLTTFALSLPVEFKYKSKSKFAVAFGGYVDFAVRTFTKYKKPNHTNKSVGDYGVNFVQFGVTAKIGYDRVYFFGSYGLTPLFEGGKGPRTNPFTVGIGVGI